MNEPKKRHGCLTTWLVMMIFFNSATALFYLVAGSASVAASYPNAPAWTVPTMAFFGVLNVVFAVALFRWKKWGFAGFFVSSLVGLALNLRIGVGVLGSLFGLSGIALLYGVLQLGGEKKGWTQLE